MGGLERGGAVARETGGKARAGRGPETVRAQWQGSPETTITKPERGLVQP